MQESIEGLLIPNPLITRIIHAMGAILGPAFVAHPLYSLGDNVIEFFWILWNV